MPAPLESTGSLYDHPDLYDTLLPVAPAQLGFYTELARRQRSVLALACGTGQIAVPIAARGISIVGLDRSPEMLDVARRRMTSSGAALELVAADMRRFDLGRRFSLIFIARNSLLHLSEQNDFAALFAVVRRHLEPDGVFAFDIFNPRLEIFSRPPGKRVQIMRVPSETYGELVVETTDDYDRAAQVNRATWYVSTPTQRDAWVVPLHLRSIFPQELLALLASNGFELLRRDGDYAGGAFTTASPTQICQCRPL